MIEVEGLNVGFGHGADRVHAVRDVSFRVPEGATFGLVGESGSGKSTVLRALSGLNPDWTGRVVIAGGQQGPRRDKAFYQLVQMVLQDPYGSSSEEGREGKEGCRTCRSGWSSVP